MKKPEPLPDGLAGLAFHVSTAARRGVSRTRTRAGDLFSPFHGIRMPRGELTVETACRAYLPLLPRGAFFSHETAARLLGIPLPGWPTDAVLPLHVSVPAPRRQPRSVGVVGHRAPAQVSLHFPAGLPTSSPCDTWCQLAASLDLDDLIVAGDRILGWPRALATTEELDEAVRIFGSRRGAVLIAAARRQIRPRSASPRETWLRLLTLRAGFPEPECNGLVQLSGGERTHGDLVYRRYRVILEYDGDHHRQWESQYHRDVDRLNDLANDGWLVIRIHRRMTEDAILAQLDRALRSRGWMR